MQEILNQAIENVPFYRHYFKSIDKNEYELKDFPIVNKANYQENINSFISDKYANTVMQIMYTSGSTGLPMKICKSRKDYFMQLKNIWEIRTKKADIKLRDKQLKFIFSNSVGKEIIRFEDSALLINCTNLTENWLKENYRIICEYEPVYCIGYASVIYSFVKMCKDINKEIPQTVKYIELLGEFVFDEQKKYIKDNVAALVVNSYGLSEVFGIAFECENGNMHCLNSNALVEIVSDDGRTCDYGEEGNIILTSLYSEAMPFIRYNSGDMGTLLRGDECSCGNCNDILRITAGRNYDYIVMPDGEKKHAGFLYGIIGAMNKKFCECIMQFEVIQHSYLSFTVELFIKERYALFTELIKKEFVRLVSEFGLQNAEWNFNIVTDSLNVRKGKYKFFRREFEK